MGMVGAPVETAHHLGFRCNLELHWENVQTKLGHEQAAHPSDTPSHQASDRTGHQQNRIRRDSRISVRAGDQVTCWGGLAEVLDVRDDQPRDGQR